MRSAPNVGWPGTHQGGETGLAPLGNNNFGAPVELRLFLKTGAAYIYLFQGR